MRELPRDRLNRIHPLAWIEELLADEPSLVVRPMFGCRAVYWRGRMVLCLAAGAEPWRGVLVPTERAQQAALIGERPALRPHPVLRKWLYLPETETGFERDAAWLVARIRAGDPRIGIEPGANRPAGKASRPGRKRREGWRSRP